MEEKEGSGFFEPEVGSAPSSQQRGTVHGHDASVGKAEGHESSDPRSHKRKGDEELLDEPRGQRHGGSDEEERGGLSESRFLGLPDSLHRIVMSFLDNRATCRLAGSSRSLGPLYLSGIKQLDTPSCLFSAASPGSKRPQPSEEALARFLGRLTCLETIYIAGNRAIKIVASAAVAASAGGAAWMETLQEAHVNPFPPFAYYKGAEGAAANDEDGHEALVTLFEQLGRGMWPRLQRLRFNGTKAFFTDDFMGLVGGLEGRGGDCERLRSLDVSVKVRERDAQLVSRLTDGSELRRLLASPCCSALEALNFGAGVSLSTSCFAQVIAYLRAPSGRGLEALCCRWIPVASENVADPAMLVNALADGCLPRLRKLEMSCLLPPGPVGPEASSALERWAEGPLSQQLEVFKCRTWAGLFRPLMEGARTGHGFPALKSIYLVMFRANGETVEELCRSLEAGAMPCLESLILQNMVAGGLARLTEALSRDSTRCSTTIKLLGLLHCDADDEEGESVGRALAAGACPGLKELDLSNASAIGNRTARSIADALRGGAAKALKQLKLSRTALGDEGCLALKAVMLDCSTSLTEVTFYDSKVTGPMGDFGLMVAAAPGRARQVFDGEEQ